MSEKFDMSNVTLSEIKKELNHTENLIQENANFVDNYISPCIIGL